MLRRLISSLLLLVLVCAMPAAADWPQWRGPDLDGTSDAENLPLTWNRDTNVAWKLPLPARGAATPIVAGDRVFLAVSHEPDAGGALELWAVGLAKGDVLWKRPLGAGNELKYKQHMASPSPVTDGKTVWTMTGTGVLAAFTVDGRELWRRNLQDDYGRFGLNWGYAASPLLWGGDLFVPVLHGMLTDAPSYLLRVDGATGKTKWRVERPTDALMESPDAYTTPMPLRRGDRTEIVLLGGDVLTGHDPATGKELWRVGGINPGKDRSFRLVASPLVVGDHIVVTGKRGPLMVWKVPATGPPTLAWKTSKGPDVPSPVSDGKLLYALDDQGILTVYELATGTSVYGPERLATGTYSASPLLTSDRLYATSETGTTTVIKTGRTFEKLAENPLGGYVLASPVGLDGRMLVRSDEALWLISPRTLGAKTGNSLISVLPSTD